MSTSSGSAAVARRSPRRSGCRREDVHLIRQAATLHDIGKVGVPDSILLKPGRLTDEEFEAMKMHVALSEQILTGSQSRLLQYAELIAAQPPRALGRRPATRAASPARRSRSPAGSRRSPTSSTRSLTSAPTRRPGASSARSRRSAPRAAATSTRMSSQPSSGSTTRRCWERRAAGLGRRHAPPPTAAGPAVAVAGRARLGERVSPAPTAVGFCAVPAGG